MSDFVRLREESSYLEGGMLLEGGNGMTDWMADDEDNYQLGESLRCMCIVVRQQASMLCMLCSGSCGS